MENEMINSVAEEAVQNVAPEVVKQVVEKAKPDLVQAGVKGLCIWGIVSFVGAGVIIGKKIYNRFGKKRAVEAPAEQDKTTEENDTTDQTADKTENN